MTYHELHALAQRLADGEAFPWEEALTLTDALEEEEGDLAAAVRVALAYDDRSGLEGLGFQVRA